MKLSNPNDTQRQCGSTRVFILFGLVLVLAAGVWAFTKFKNELVALETSALTQWQQVNVQLVRQFELIPKLVDVTQAYAAHERDILNRLSEARTRYQNSAAEQQPEAAGAVDAALGDWLVLAEQYPDIKADQVYRDLAYELAGTKNRITTERMRYNYLVGEYNTRKHQMPWRIAAAGKADLLYYELPEGQLTEPDWAIE